MKPYFVAALLALPTLAGAADSLKFAIKQYRVEGNSVLPDARVQNTLAPFVGEGRDFADVQHALEALETLYRTEGFGALQVYLPEQELNQGTIVLKVVEPKLGKVLVEGNRYFGEPNIRRGLPVLQEGKVPNTAEMAANLRLSNESPSRQTVVTLQAGDTPQTVDAKVTVVDEKPWRAFASVDNTGTTETGTTRLSIGFQHANLFDKDHVLTAQATGSPKEPSKVKIVGVGYKLPFYQLGDSLNLLVGYSSVDSGVPIQGAFNALGSFDINGKGAVAGAHYIQNLAGIGAYQHKLNWGLDWRRFDTQTTFVGSPLPGNRYTLQPLSLGYQLNWQNKTLSVDANAALSHNIPNGEDIGALNDEGVPISGRLGAKTAYSIARLGGNVYASLPADWTAHLAINSQFTNDALPSGEQMGIGGVGSVRGYDERILSNDYGVAASVETFSPELGKYLTSSSLNLRALAFYDFGMVRRNDAALGETTSALLAGAGLGIRMSWGKNASLKVDFAKSLKDAGSQKKGDSKAHISAVVSY